MHYIFFSFFLSFFLWRLEDGKKKEPPPPPPLPNLSVRVPMGVDRLLTVPSCSDRCNEPTTVTYQDAYYTATIAGQTITITNCPCTITTTSVRTMDCPPPPIPPERVSLVSLEGRRQGERSKKRRLAKRGGKGGLKRKLKTRRQNTC